MISKSLTAITHDLIESYGNTAHNVITAYRIGNERAVELMGKGWSNALTKAGSRLNDDVRENAAAAQKKLAGLYSNAITLTTDGADTAVDKAVELAGKSIRQVAANAGRFEKATGVTALNALADAAVPAAQVVVELASKIEAQSGILVQKAGGSATKAKVAQVKRSVTRKVGRVRKSA